MSLSGSPTTEASPAAAEHRAADRAPAARRVRVAASADDLARLALGTIVAVLASLAYLFATTDWGAVDATAFDTAIAAAILLTPAPTWLSWMLAAALDDQATPGQYRRGLRVHLRRADRATGRLLRFALHPLSTPGWLWLAAIAFLLGTTPLSWLFLAVAALVALGGLGSLALLALGRRALHDLALRSEVRVRPEVERSS